MESVTHHTRYSAVPSVAAISLLLMLSLLASAARGEEEAPAELKDAVARLSSDTFLEREKASQTLLAAGAKAIALLEASVSQSDLETTARVLGVLETMALDSEDPSTREAAMAAVTRLAASPSPAVAQRSETLLAAIGQVRRRGAIAHLERLGAKIERSQAVFGPGFLAAEYSLTIGPDWRGTDDDLKHLALIFDLHVVSLVGDKANDAWLEHVASLASLQSLKLKKTKVTAAGIERLKALEELQVLDVLYTPLDDAAIRPLADMPQLSLVRLFGTQVSQEAADRLAAGLPGAKVDRRNGGFLGIGVQAHPLGCTISNVQPGSAAERIGIQEEDIVLSFAGKNPRNFEELTKVIGQYKPGDEVTVELYRDGRRLTKTLKLGEWE